MPIATDQTYMFDPSRQDERRRLEMLQALRDPGSVQRLERTGVGPGWRCLEVGAGRGSIARWLARRAGADGSVLAIDLEPDLLDDIDEPNIEVRAADVRDLDVPPGTLDLIHVRAVLMHVPQRTRAIERMASWLAPGGWLVVEELDWSRSTTADAAWTAILAAYEQAAAAMDWTCGRELVAQLAAAGLDVISADAEIDAIQGGTAVAGFYGATLEALRDAVLAAGTARDAEIARALERLQDPAFRAPGVTWVGVRCRRDATRS